MNILKKITVILIFFFLNFSISHSNEKTVYLDIDYVLTNTIAGKQLLNNLKKEEELKIKKFKLNDDNFKNEEKKILAKKNLISKEDINKELKLLKIEFDNYRKEKTNEIEKFKNKRNKNIINFLNLINPIIEKYMSDNSIYMLIDKKNVFIASKDFDITNNLIELINNKIKIVEIK